MIRFNLSSFIKILLGIILVQAATAVQVVAALRSGTQELWLLFGLLALTMGVLAAFWFISIIHHVRKDAVADLKEDFSKERERIRLSAEKEKAKVVRQSQRQITRERNRTQTRADLKVGLSFAGVGVLGVMMLFSQFVTIGMLLLTGAGGALGGYLLRTRQDFLARRKKQQAAIGGTKPEKLIPPTLRKPSFAAPARDEKSGSAKASDK